MKSIDLHCIQGKNSNPKFHTYKLFHTTSSLTLEFQRILTINEILLITWNIISCFFCTMPKTNTKIHVQSGSGIWLRDPIKLTKFRLSPPVPLTDDTADFFLIGVCTKKTCTANPVTRFSNGCEIFLIPASHIKAYRFSFIILLFSFFYSSSYPSPDIQINPLIP